MVIDDIYERFIVARWCYLMGESILSDVEYDHLEKEFKEKFPEDEHSKHGWAFDECPTELLAKHGLNHLICNPVMGYMAESIDSINTQELFEEVFRSLNERSRLSFKIDGWNTRVSYYNGVLVKVESRGRSGNNLSMNELAPLFPKRIKIMGRVAITGELNIPNRKWKDFKAITGNNDQRASVRTALARGMIDYLEFVAFNIFCEAGYEYNDSYELLNELGFTCPRFKWVSNYDELVKAIKYMSYISKAYYYLTDGLVIENSNMQLAIRLGAWEEQAMCSYVTGYTSNQGMYGVFMNVTCYPIRIDGKKFTEVSINNIASIIENDLQVGYPIAFVLRSSANVTLDVTMTRKLQNLWRGKYDAYQKSIESKSD